MKDPVMAETWQTAFNKDFGGLCQGDDKTGTVGTDAMFVMTPQDVTNMPADQHEVLRMNQEGLVISQGGWIGFVVG
jgi:hypothetical protein